MAIKFRLNKYSYILIFTLLLAVTSMFSGCNNNRLKLLEVKSELCNYSFEYSTRYKLDGPSILLDRTTPSVFVILGLPARKEKAEVFDPDTGKISTVTGYRGPGGISISVYDISNYSTAPQTALERLEQTLKGRSRDKTYELLERSSIDVSGHKAEMVRYYSDRLTVIPSGDSEYTKAAYLDYNNLIWVIEGTITLDLIDQLDVDFDHIINTFTIYD